MTNAVLFGCAASFSNRLQLNFSQSFMELELKLKFKCWNTEWNAFGNRLDMEEVFGGVSCNELCEHVGTCHFEEWFPDRISSSIWMNIWPYHEFYWRIVLIYSRLNLQFRSHIIHDLQRRIDTNDVNWNFLLMFLLNVVFLCQYSTSNIKLLLNGKADTGIKDVSKCGFSYMIKKLLTFIIPFILSLNENKSGRYSLFHY